MFKLFHIVFSILVILVCFFTVCLHWRFHSDIKYEFTSNESNNRLRHFTAREVVSCIDDLHVASNQPWLHFTFIGDSRTRQQFYNLLKIIPDEDRQIQPQHMYDFFTPAHEDVTVTSHLLKLIVSFRWRPLLDANFTKEISQWLHEPPVSIKRSNAIYPPSFIFIGLASHHMLEWEAAEEYERVLEEKIKPILNQMLEIKTRSSIGRRQAVIWSSQLPTVDYWAKNDDNNADIFREKMHKYNLIAQQVLRGNSQVDIWDSGNSLAEEYVRACNYLRRYEIHPGKTWIDKNSRAYYNCIDFIHTGYVALSQTIQILLNHICIQTD